MNTRTEITRVFPGVASSAITNANGLITTGGTDMATFLDPTNYVPGTYGFYDGSSFIDPANPTPPCCDIQIVGASPYSKAKISKLNPGYKSPIRSSKINPKNVRFIKRIDPCDQTPNIWHVGATPLNSAGGNCDATFLCDHDYNLMIDVTGDQAYASYFRNVKRMVRANTGCCVNDTDVYVDPVVVYIAWAEALAQDEELKNFVYPIVYYNGTYYYAPQSYYPDVTLPPGAQTWDTITPAAASATPFAAQDSGLILQGTFIDQTFGNCTFQLCDGYTLEPVKLQVSMVDDEGNPCQFEGVCLGEECEGRFRIGSGEQVFRSLARSEDMRGFPFRMDLRQREIEQGGDLQNLIDRSTNYYQYIIGHVATKGAQYPIQTSNPELWYEIIVTPSADATLETFLNSWVSNCGVCDGLETIGCDSCTVTTPIV